MSLLEGRRVLASSGKRPGMLVNVLQCTTAPRQRITQPKGNSAEAEIPAVETHPVPGTREVLSKYLLHGSLREH